MTYIDCHTHILPALDDGPSDMAEALALARALLQAGFTGVVATPHLSAGSPNEAVIRQRLSEFKTELARRQIPLEIYPGAEYAVELHLAKRFKAGELLTLNNSRFLLIEPPAFQPLPPFLDELIFDLRLLGCYPILAHPERCLAFQQDPGRLSRLIRSGALTQITVSSLTGDMGPEASRAAAQFFKFGLVHILATDAHHADGRLTAATRALPLAEKLNGPGTAALMLSERPAMILQDRLPPLPEPKEVSGEKTNKKWPFSRRPRRTNIEPY